MFRRSLSLISLMLLSCLTEEKQDLTEEKQDKNKTVDSTPAPDDSEIPTLTEEQSTIGSVIDAHGYEMVRIEAGSFQMGSTSGNNNDEKPAHRVSISQPFLMGETEVTQGLWEEVMGSNPSQVGEAYWDDKNQGACSAYGVGETHPVMCMSWLDSVKFANRLSELEGLEPCYNINGDNVSWPDGLDCTGYRLPTEAEWEYAARADDGTKYAGSNSAGSVAWYSENSGSKTHAVGGKTANGWGLYDMSGNVWEWVWDWYDDYSSSSVTDPAGPNSGSNRVYRGGSWDYSASYTRGAHRFRFTPSYRNFNLGLRLSRSL